MNSELSCIKYSQLREKEVVNTIDGSCLGHPFDLELDLDRKRFTALLLPPANGLFCFGKKELLRIPVERIEKIGADVILVRLFEPLRTESEK